MSETSRHGDVNPMNYLKILFRRKELVIFPAFIALVLGICAGMVLPKKYRSATILLVEEGKSDNPLFNNLAVSTTVGERMNTISESMLGWNSLVKLVRRLNLDKDVKTPRELEKLILDIRKDITIRLRGRNIIDLSYIGNDAQLTQAVVKNITEIFIERNVDIQNQETADAIAFIEEQLKLYRGKIKSAEIAELNDALKTLLTDSTELHPRVKELREQITVKEAELKKENLEYVENVNLDMKTVSPIVQEIKNALDNIEGKTPTEEVGEDAQQDFYKLMLVDKLDKVQARDASVNNTIYNMLLQRLETAKITQRLQSSKEGTKYTVLDPPRVPLSPIKPNKIMVALAGLMMGLMLGLGLVFGVEFLDKSFIDVADANDFLGQPLLGAISKINTEANLRSEHEKLRWAYSLTFVAGMVAIMVTAAVANFIK
jgi:uncharacterized protein involved in exopolysaccharide biosynthesis